MADRLLVDSVAGYAEALALLGRSGTETAEVRLPGAVGARIPWAADNHWADAAVVPVGAAPPKASAEDLPHCLWSTSGVPGRSRVEATVMPAMALEDLATFSAPEGVVRRVPLREVGELNDLAYSQHDVLGRALAPVDPDALHVVAIVRDGALAAVATALDLGEDTSVQWVATHPANRRRGYANALLHALLADARSRGQRTATLQASPDGLPLYERLGFRVVGTLHGYVS